MTTFAHVETFPEPNVRERCLVLSIKPKYVDKILAGTKTVELRRTAPDLEPGAPVLLYSSSPVKAAVGYATLRRVDARSPSGLWADVAGESGVTRAEYRDYFRGADRAYALQLVDVVGASTSISLERMRLLGLEPPQSWRYIDSDLADRFFDLMNSA